MNLAVHPGGRFWVFRSDGPDGPRLVQRHLGSDEVREIPETEDGSHPFWSPDGRHLGFVAGTTIRRVEPSTGVARTVFSVEGSRIFGTPSWGADGSILYATTGPESAGVLRVSANGGRAEQVLTLDDIPGSFFLGWPRHLPDGNHFLVLAGGIGLGSTGAQLFVASLGGEDPFPLPEVGSRALFVEPGILLYVRRDRLLAQRFDPDELRLRGEPVALVEGVSVRVRPGSAAFAASPDLLVAGRS